MKSRIIALVLAVLLLSSVAYASSGDKYDLSNFGWRTVDSKGRGSLVFQKAPRGKAIKGHRFYTGDQIYVNLNYREDGYGFAYEDGEYGYVDASYIDWSSGKSSGSSTGSISSGSGSGTVSFSGDSNVRSGPGLDYGTVGSVKKGQTLSYAGETRTDDRGVNWYAVYYNSKKCWVSSRYSSLKGASASKKSGSSSSSSKSSGSSGSSTQYVRITDSCNVRQGPGLSYDVIDTVSKGTRLEYFGSTKTDSRGVDWYNVIYGNLSAWVSSKYAVYDGKQNYTASDDSGLTVTNGRTDLFSALGYPKEEMVWRLNMKYDDAGGYSDQYAYTGGPGSLVYEVGILKKNSKYCIEGLTYGMKLSDAKKQLKNRGWQTNGTPMEEHDLHVYSYVNGSGSQIEISSYDYDDFTTAANIIAYLVEPYW